MRRAIKRRNVEKRRWRWSTEERRGRLGRRRKLESRRREVERREGNSGRPGGATRGYPPRFRRSVADSGESWDHLRGTRVVGKREEGE
ncbi:hypothetical protein NDU88_007667 [Pleurodeles waltl]|uniref:Uncharacterized protein n=1 Tax=Pleurodeles waltl TaxID=8319 RepID=A0AAV7QQJ3_PLEWA|nr:hypothetical protein NDU88_007667 [Pleurodeles waltl]